MMRPVIAREERPKQPEGSSAEGRKSNLTQNDSGWIATLRFAPLAMTFLLLCFSLSLRAQDLDSLYRVFENSKGETAYQAAVAIDEVIGREPNFEMDTDKDEIKLKVLRTMILYFFNNDDFQHVVTYSEIGIAHYEKIGDLFNEAGCYMTLANAYQRLGQFDKAIDCYNHCNELMDEIGGEMAEVNKRYVVNNIAEIHLAMGEYNRAEEMYHKCVEMLGEVQVNDTASNLDMATYCQNLAEVYLAQGKRDEAVSLAEQSLELSQRYQDTPNKIINRMMTLSKATGNPEILDEALRLAEDNNELFLQAVLNLQKGDYAKAIAMAEENHYDGILRDALEAGYQDLRTSDPAKALEYLERSVVMKDSIFNENQQQLIRDYQVRYATQEKEHELAMQQAKNRQIRWLAVGLVVLAVVLLALFLVWWRLAQTRKKRNEELMRLNETKDRLISIVSHDVRTPVSAICNVLGQLCAGYDGMNDTDRKASLVMLKSTSEALNDRLFNILQWVKSVLEHGTVNPADFKVVEVVDECIHNQAYTFELKSLKVTNEVPEDLMAYDDVSVVSLVLQNLLSNAVKFSYPSGEIHIKAEEKDSKIWVLVSDNGMGIGEKKLEKIFRFLTTSEMGTEGERGTGIGLFVSKQLLDKTGGEIRIESVIDEGTTVRFSINKLGVRSEE